MSIKKLFGASENNRNYLSNANEKEAFNDDIESARNLRELSIRDEQNIPQVDYSRPENFARFGSAYLYYKSAIERIVDYYPYDGSDAEINKFHNQSLDIEKYILDNLYPRTTGYATLNVAGYGTDSPTITDGYGAPAAGYAEHITFYGGPNTGSGGETAAQLGPNPYSGKQQHSNIYDEDIYQTEGLPSDYGKGTRTSNLRANFNDGLTMEFWLKTGSYMSPSLSGKQVVFDWWNNKDSGDPDYGRILVELTSSADGDDTPLKPFLVTVSSGSTSLRSAIAIGDSSLHGGMGDWRHYAISIANSSSALQTKLYVDGVYAETITSEGSYSLSSSATAYTPLSTKSYSSHATLQGWWKIDEDLSTDTPYDVSGKGRNGSFDAADDRPTYAAGITPSTDIQLNTNTFDATDDRINIGTAATWNNIIGSDYSAPSDSPKLMSFSAWIYKTGDGGSGAGRIVDFGDNDVMIRTTTSEAIYMSFRWTGMVVSWYTVDGATSGLALNSWNHIVVTYDANSTANVPKIYVNGSEIALANSPTVSGEFGGIVGPACYIGNNSDGDRAFEGKIADFAVWNSILTADEVSAIYNAPTFGGLRRYGAPNMEELNSKGAVGRIGALLTNPAGLSAASGSGKLSGSMDEFRFWKVARNGQQIGRNWFTQVRGGVNTDIANTTLGLYFKFNEGITGDAIVDQHVLDYGGRVCNGLWEGYTSTSRNLNSAMLEASASSKEYRDPIIHAAHPSVSGLKDALMSSGSYHDRNNNASFLSLTPGWVLDEHDEKELSDLSNIAHIAGAYFDKLYLQISQLPRMRQLNYVSGAYKPLTFAEHLPQSLGLATPNLFIDANVMERFANRNDKELFEGNLEEVKNLIYINLYNNLANIFKAKGTEKAIKNVFRCFNIDDKLLRVSITSNNNEYVLRNNLEQTLISKNCLNFNDQSNIGGVVYQAVPEAATRLYASGFIRSSSMEYDASPVGTLHGEDRAGFTLESNIVFPHYMKSYDKLDRDFNTVSLFGVNMIDTGSATNRNGTETSTLTYDKANFRVYAVRDDKYSKNVHFKLSSPIGPGFGTELTSSTFLNVYDNELWNLSVRLKPSKYPLAGYISGTTLYDVDATYELEFCGINTVSTAIANSFTASATIDGAIARNFLNNSKRVSVGAERTNLTGAILNESDVLVSSIKYWTSYLDGNDLLQHALDPENTGISGSYQNISPLLWQKSNADILNANTLVLDWNFLDVTGSDSNGVFTTQDFSSGSATARRTQGWVGEIAGWRHPGIAYGFADSSETVIDKKHQNSHRFVNPEHVVSSDMVQLFSDTDELYPNLRREEIIPNYVYTIEKSLYNAISEEMLDFFAGVVDFNNIIGHPVNRYRGRYKAMEKLREVFFRRVTSVNTVEKYITYYKWFDDALTDIISQLVPASSEFVNDVLNVVESHVLERNKYKSKFPTLDFVEEDLDAYMVGIHEKKYPWADGHSPLQQSPRSTDEHPYFWKHRALRSAPEISASLPDGTSATYVNSDREKAKNLIYARPHVSMSLPLLSTIDGQQYLMPDLARQRFTTLYDFETEDSKQMLKANLSVGTNYSPIKNVAFAPSTFRGLGAVETEGSTYIPLNVLLSKVSDIVETTDFRSPIEPADNTPKKHRRFKVMYGPDFGYGLTYLNTNTQHAFPFNIMSSTVETGFNMQVVQNVTGNIEITNRHPEGWGPENNVGLQGPFAFHNVGGHQSRHIALNKGSDNWMTRPERDKVLLGGCAENAIGITDPFYPYPEANDEGVNPYPLTAAQGAIYYRDYVAQSPFNIKNIPIVTGANELGNYTYKYEVFNSVGAYANPRQFIETQPTLPTASFQHRATASTQIRGLWDIHRTTENHFEWVSEYSTAYLEGTPNQSIIVGRFRVAGGIEQETYGYADFKSREYSVYNAIPYRNWTVLKPSQGPSGTLSEPVGSTPSEMRVYDIHGLDYGLISHEARHTARFGRDSLQVTGTSFATDGPGASYDQAPGWHKINRNNKQRVIGCGEETTYYNTNTGIQNLSGLSMGTPVNAGSNQYGKLYHSSSFLKDNSAISTTTWTVGVWIKPNANIGNYSSLVSLGDNGASSNRDIALDFGIKVNASYYRLSLWSKSDAGDKGKFYGDIEIVTGSWQHVAFTWNGAVNTTPTFYVNGVADTTNIDQAAGDNNVSVNSVGSGQSYIGGTNRDSANSHKSLPEIDIDEITIYDTVLSASEMSTLYSNGGVLNLTSSLAPAPTSLVTWLRCGDVSGDPTEGSEVNVAVAGYAGYFHDQMGNNDYIIKGTNGNSTFVEFVSQSAPGGLGISYITGSQTVELVCDNELYDNWFIQHQIPRSDRQYAWITGALLDGQNIRYNGFQSTAGRGMGPYLSQSTGVAYFYDFVNLSDVVAGDGSLYPGGQQPTNRINILTLDPVTGATDNIATNTLGYPLTADVSNYLNTALNPTIQGPDYLNALLCRRGAKYDWTWRASREYNNPILVNERSYNTLTAITGAGQTLLDGYRLPPVSLKGRPAFINFNSPSTTKREYLNNATLKITHDNNHIYFNELALNNLTHVRPGITPFNQIVAIAANPTWQTRFIIYRQNVFPSMKNEFASWSTGLDRTSTYKNNVWNEDFSTRVALADPQNLCGISVSQSMFCLDPPGGNPENPATPGFLTRTGPVEINQSTELALKDNGLAGSLQNIKFSYMKGTAVDDSVEATRYRRMRSLAPGPMGWAKHMVGSPNSITRIGAQDIPETASYTGSFDLDEQIEIYSGEADWQSDTPTKAGVVIFNASTREGEFQVTGSTPWFDTYEDYWYDLKLMAKGYSVLPEFRISEHVEDYLAYGVGNKGLIDSFEFPGVDPILNSTSSAFYTTYTNSDFMKGFLKVSEDALLEAKEIRLSCDAAIRWRPQPSFYPAQRAAEMVSQFSKSYGDAVRGVFRNEVMTGSALFEDNGGCLRPMFEALYSPGILFNTFKAGVACNYPIITDNTQIKGTWFGASIGDSYTDNYALVPNNVNVSFDPDNTPAGRSKWPAQGFFGGSPFFKLPFETIIEPARHLNGITFYDMQPHPSMSLTEQYYTSNSSPFQGAETTLASKTDDPAYTLFARNFLGEIPSFFLKDGTFSSVKSNVVPADLTFPAARGPQATAGGYFMRIKMIPPSNGQVGRENEFGADGTNAGFGKFGGLTWDNITDTNSPAWGTGEFELPQWPSYNPDFKRTQTNTVRTTAYSSIAVAGRPSGRFADEAADGTNHKCFLDSFVGSNPLYTHPIADGEAWIDCWFYPSASSGKITETYDLERILAETEIRTWRFDPGYVTGSAGENAPALISASNAVPMFYDGHLINQVAMQATASLNYMGVERVFKTETDKFGTIQKQTTDTAGMRWIITPKFETPTLNFSDQGIKPITSASNNLTLPVYGSASVNRGIWQQFGAYPTKPSEYPTITVEGPDDTGGGVRQWLKYHYKVMNEDSLYNDYDAARGYTVSRNVKSLAKLVGFDRDTRSTQLGRLAEKQVLKEAVVAVPYIIKEVPSRNDLDPCTEEKQLMKKFITIPERRVKAALKEAVGTSEGDSLTAAGVSIRNLASRLEEFVLPPQLDWVHNADIKPIVMYVFPFEYELDKDDLSYIYQNLAPRNGKKIRLKSTSVAHNLLNTELLRRQNIMTTSQLRWMVFKVKQRSMGDYYDHVPNNAGEASVQLTNFVGARDRNPKTAKKREYPISYNWPYDYISLIELARLDVEVMYRTSDGQKKKKKAQTDNYIAGQSARKLRRSSKPAANPIGGNRKKKKR